MAFSVTQLKARYDQALSKFMDASDKYRELKFSFDVTFNAYNNDNKDDGAAMRLMQWSTDFGAAVQRYHTLRKEEEYARYFCQNETLKLYDDFDKPSPHRKKQISRRDVHESAAQVYAARFSPASHAKAAAQQAATYMDSCGGDAGDTEYRQGVDSYFRLSQNRPKIDFFLSQNSPSANKRP
jgi:hypothetical protein